jgi:hypothetical protein
MKDISGQLLTEDTKEAFFRIAYPVAIYQNYVDYYFEIQQPLSSSPFHVNGLPSSNTLIAFNLNHQPWSSVKAGSEEPLILKNAQFLGQTSVLYTGIYQSGMHVFFVKLKPGIASLIFNEKATIFENGQIDFAYLWKHSSLEEQIQEASGFSHRISLFQHALLNNMVNNNAYQKVERLNKIMNVFNTLQLKGEKEIERICKSNWITYPSARRDFLQYIGYTPKYCQKTSRLKNALKAYKQSGYHFYYEDFGYTDFSHFAKDARQLTGRTPAMLV